MSSLPFDIVIIPPQNFLPAAQTFEANRDAPIAGLSIFAYLDATAVTTTLSVAHGTLAATSVDGTAIAGSGTATLTLTGTAKQINATLSAPGNLIYHGAHDFFGADTLTVVTNDGYNWPVGPLTDTDHVSIEVGTLLAGGPKEDAFTALPGNERIDAGGGIDTITFGFKLTDAKVSYAGNTVVIDGPASHTVLTGFEVFKFADGTVNNNDSDWLVDDLFYYSRNPGVWTAGLDADQNYHQSGWHQGRDPSAFFSTSTYLSANPDVKAAGVDPLLHFHEFGWHEGRVSSLDFDPLEYLATYRDVAAAKLDPLEHFLHYGAAEGRQTFAPPAQLNGFDAAYYLQHNPDVAAAGVDPLQHYETVGWKEGRNPNALFDVSGYLAHYADVKQAGIDPLAHYHQFGWQEGRDPSVNFDTTSYLAAYADVQAAHIDPLLHFLQYGHAEGRSAFGDGAWG